MNFVENVLQHSNSSRNGYTSNVDLFGTVSGLFQSGNSLGGFIGPLLGVVLTEQLGFEWGITCVAGFMVSVVSFWDPSFAATSIVFSIE